MKNSRETEIEFCRKLSGRPEYPEARTIIIRQYGGTLETCVAKARAEFNLKLDEWEVVRFES